MYVPCRTYTQTQKTSQNEWDSIRKFLKLDIKHINSRRRLLNQRPTLTLKC